MRPAPQLVIVITNGARRLDSGAWRCGEMGEMEDAGGRRIRSYGSNGECRDIRIYEIGVRR